MKKEVKKRFDVLNVKGANAKLGSLEPQSSSAHTAPQPYRQRSHTTRPLTNLPLVRRVRCGGGDNWLAHDGARAAGAMLDLDAGERDLEPSMEGGTVPRKIQELQHY